MPGHDCEIASVIGHPVSHSLSPRIFSYLAERLGRKLAYKRLDLTEAELIPFFRAVSDKKLFVGWNVTVPHKQTAATLVDDLSPAAAKIGAVNVVHFTPVGVEGHNTDIVGINETLREQGVKLARGNALLYGAGGAARAVAYALGASGARRVHVLNRTPKRAKALCRHFGKVFPGTEFLPARDPDEAEDARLLVNATTLGLEGTNGSFPFPERVAEGALAFDLIYRPAVTSFLKGASKRGLRTVNGLDMLIWQALATWEIWFGKLADREKLKRALVRLLKED